ncbi:MAG: hypothetical protein IJP29_08605 [Lachnospiraceae bacterium]|nr:hypothetical protein [Lachnospiraceae bacterium]
MKKNGNKTFTLMIFLVAIVALGYFIYLNNKAPDRESVDRNSEKEILLNYDMVENYPKTVRETTKMHCRYLKYVYSDEFIKEGTEDEIFTMNQKIRALYDDELLELNSPTEQLQALKDEMTLYEVNKQKIVSYTLSEASQIEYNTENGIEYAKMQVTLALTIDGASASVDEEYILRKDSEGRWKILGWQVKQQQTVTEEGDAE